MGRALKVPIHQQAQLDTCMISLKHYEYMNDPREWVAQQGAHSPVSLMVAISIPCEQPDRHGIILICYSPLLCYFSNAILFINAMNTLYKHTAFNLLHILCI